MKKILLLIVLLLPNRVLAETFYSDYVLISENNENNIITNDLILEEPIKFYNTFENVVSSSEYAMFEKNTLDNPFINFDDFIYKEVFQQDFNSNFYNYETLCYNNNFKTKEIVLSDFKNNVTFVDHKIYYNDVPYGHTVKANNFEGSLTDFLYRKEAINFKENGELIFKFFNEAELENINIILKSQNDIAVPSSFKIKISDYSYQINYELHNTDTISITFKNNYENIIHSKNMESDLDCTSYYTSKEKFYKYYNIEKIPLNIYVSNIENNIITDDYKYLYNYYQREKIELYDDIIITDKLDINNIIKYSSKPLESFKFQDNINYNLSGIYTLDIFYLNKLIGSTNITYIKPELIETDNIMSIKEITKTQEVKNNDTYINKIVKSPTSRVNKITNMASIKTTRQDRLIILIVIFLIVMLLIFQLILLYVKHKYYKD